VNSGTGEQVGKGEVNKKDDRTTPEAGKLEDATAKLFMIYGAYFRRNKYGSLRFVTYLLG
jgi:hypothetical protein